MKEHMQEEESPDSKLLEQWNTKSITVLYIHNEYAEE